MLLLCNAAADLEDYEGEGFGAGGFNSGLPHTEPGETSGVRRRGQSAGRGCASLDESLANALIAMLTLECNAAF